MHGHLTQCIYVLLDREAAVLLVARRSQIIANQINLKPPQLRPVVSGSSIVTVDFDRLTSRIYWADATLKTIWSAYLNGTERQEVSELVAHSKLNIKAGRVNHSTF